MAIAEQELLSNPTFDQETARPFPFSKSRYSKMVELGLMQDDQFTLVDGDIFDKRTGEPFLFTKEQYYILHELDYFLDMHVELIEGVIFKLAAIGTRHWITVNRVNRILTNIFPETYIVSIQNPVNTSKRSEPEPDALVCVGPDIQYIKGIPQQAVLVIEVSHTTLRHDRMKQDQYARAGVPDYWIINLKNDQVEVYRNPSGEREIAGSGKYDAPLIFKSGDFIAPLSAPDHPIEVARLLPQFD